MNATAEPTEGRRALRMQSNERSEWQRRGWREATAENEVNGNCANERETGSKMAKKKQHNEALTDQVTGGSTNSDFESVLGLIVEARGRAEQAINVAVMDLYWSIGAYLSEKISADGWGKNTVKELSEYIQTRQPGIRGYSPQNLWRMRQFFETYKDDTKLSTALRELYPVAEGCFKDSYSLEFLGLCSPHDEADLHKALLQNLGRFLTELGRDFCFVGSEFPLQVGGQDFSLDLLFFHRGLNSLVAIELKAARFKPEHFGKLEFYLEALDRDVRKPHENPSIGILLCATKDSEVVEYALSRSLSPAMVAEYVTRLPDKKLLQAKLHEFYQLMQDADANE